MIWPWAVFTFIVGFFTGAGMILMVWDEDDNEKRTGKAIRKIYGDGEGKN